MPFQIQSRETEYALILSEDLTITDAASLHAALLPLALEARPLVIEAGEVTGLHTSIVQILLSLKLSAPQCALRSGSPALAAAAVRLGLKAHPFFSRQPDS